MYHYKSDFNVLTFNVCTLYLSPYLFIRFIILSFPILCALYYVIGYDFV